MRSVILVLAVLATACGSKAAPEPTTPTPPTTPTESRYIGGGLSEAEFKALHQPPVQGPATPRKGERVQLPDGTTAYLSLPAGQGPWPAIVVIHEWWGLNENIEIWSDRLASAGWAAIAVDLYGKVATTPDEAMAIMKTVDPAKANRTIRAALDFATSDSRIKATKRASIGWCFGGRWSLEAAIANADLDGAIIYYGKPETDPARLSTVKARVLGIFGLRDQGIPMADVEAMEAGLAQAKVDVKIHKYDAEHAFANPSNPKYDQENAADAWAKVIAFLGSLNAR